jgi:hypothetical protein
MKALITVPVVGLVDIPVDVLGFNLTMHRHDGDDWYTVQGADPRFSDGDGLYCARLREITLLPVWPAAAVLGDDPSDGALCPCCESETCPGCCDDHYGPTLVARRSGSQFQGIA